jgi:hypothetical protein
MQHNKENKHRLALEFLRVSSPLMLNRHGFTDERAYWEAHEKGYGEEAPRFFSAGMMLDALSLFAYCWTFGNASQIDRQLMALALSVIAHHGERLATFAEKRDIIRDDSLRLVGEKAKSLAMLLDLPLDEPPSELKDNPLHAAAYVRWSAEPKEPPTQLVLLQPLEKMCQAVALAWECAAHRGFALERYSSCCNLARLRQTSALQLAQERAEKLTVQEALYEEQDKVASTAEEKEKLARELQEVQEEKRQALAKVDEANGKLSRMDELDEENKRLQAKIDKRKRINRENASGPRKGENPEADWDTFLPWLHQELTNNNKKAQHLRAKTSAVIQQAIETWNLKRPTTANGRIVLEWTGVETKYYRWKRKQTGQQASEDVVDSSGGGESTD